jgi:hypothetical protein
MRILCAELDHLKTCQVIEITCAGYHDMYKFGDGTDTSMKGLYVVDTQGNYLLFKHVPMPTCNEICHTLAEKGFIDLRKYGSYITLSI